MYYNQDNLRTEQVQYRCTKAHKDKIKAIQKDKTTEYHWRKISVADILEEAVNNLHQSLKKPIPAIKPKSIKKTVTKTKTLKK